MASRLTALFCSCKEFLPPPKTELGKLSSSLPPCCMLTNASFAAAGEAIALRNPQLRLQQPSPFFQARLWRQQQQHPDSRLPESLREDLIFSCYFASCIGQGDGAGGINAVRGVSTGWDTGWSQSTYVCASGAAVITPLLTGKPDCFFCPSMSH